MKLKMILSLFMVVVVGTVFPLMAQTISPEGASCIVDTYEPNDSCGMSATRLGQGQTEALYLCEGEQDWFTVNVPAGFKLQVDVNFTHSNDTDLNAVLYEDDCSTLADSSNSSTDNEQLLELPKTTGEQYYFAVYGADALDDALFDLDIRMSCNDCFSYQGQLKNNGNLLNGSYQFVFQLYDAEVDGTAVTQPITQTLLLNDGLFSTQLYFGDPDFFIVNGTPLFVDVKVRRAGSINAYTTLSPRQDLLPAPIAHTIVPGAVISGSTVLDGLINLDGGALSNGININEVGNTGLAISEAGGNGIYMGQTGQNGILIADAQQSGLRVNNAYDGLYVVSADATGVEVSSATTGLYVGNTTSHGVHVANSGHRGVNVDSAVTGFYAGTATYGTYINNALNTGIYVNDSGGNGMFVNDANTNGFYANTVSNDGLYVFSAGDDGVEVNSAGDNGLYIGSSTNEGIHINDANGYGIRVDDAEGYGLYIGNVTQSSGGTGGDGIYVFNTVDDGLFISQPADHGIHINSAGDRGLYVHSAANDGVYVASAGGHGVYGRTTTSNRYGGYFTTNSSSGSALYASSGSSGYDIVLGGWSGSITTNQTGADIRLYANDTTTIHLNEDGDDPTSYFEILNRDNSTLFNVSENLDKTFMYGDAAVTGNLSKGGGSFVIDHPLDPENQLLYHSFVESPDMMNVYNGNVTLDANGEAWIQLPDYFESLNRDFRYQLTPIGAPALLYVAETVKDNQFKIAGGEAGMTVSWQVTGIRQDPYANENRIPVEVEKEDTQKGLYLHPEAWGQSAEQQMDLNPTAESEDAPEASHPTIDQTEEVVDETQE